MKDEFYFLVDARWHPRLSGEAQVALNSSDWVCNQSGVWFVVMPKLWKMLVSGSVGVLARGEVADEELQGRLNRFLVECGIKPR